MDGVAPPAHKNFADDEPTPFKFLDRIGDLYGPLVHAVEASEDEYGIGDNVVVKILRYKVKKDREKALNELKNLKVLCHHHIIALVASYTKGKEFGIVMFPVAEYHLGKWMRMVSETPRNESYISKLRSYFACLCRALIYLHTREMPIKHKDIKPENILIDKRRTIILTDFGISKEYEDVQSTRTTGVTDYTLRYAAPEAVNYQDRGLDADVFSLGCVFLEMISVVLGESLENLHEALEVPGGVDKSVRYSSALNEVKIWIEHLRMRCKDVCQLPVASDSSQCSSQRDNVEEEALNLILKMMSSDPVHRPQLQNLLRVFEKMTDKPCKDCLSNDHAEARRPSRTGSDRAVDNDRLLPTLSYDGSPVGAADTSETENGKVILPESRAEAPRVSPQFDATIPLLQIATGVTSISGGPHSSSVHGYDSERPTIEEANRSQAAVRISPQQAVQAQPDGAVVHWVNQQESADFSNAIAVYHVRKKTRDSLKASEVPGKSVVIYDDSGPCQKNLTVVSKAEMDWTEPGILICLPRTNGWRVRTPQGDMNLWKQLSRKDNVSRMFGSIRMMFLKGNFPPDQMPLPANQGGDAAPGGAMIVRE
ncbi:hypothetical protein B0A49_09806 [Cryomyces minteri]|uniref:Protein kinase domain-containing protein n=1 Tax=Cryomyces minteri TaxID=331657 RepID=A0A4U0WRC3_9PEZI|nr:hypothetical protein B0A49_09806 [Cryomyces minteri]